MGALRLTLTLLTMLAFVEPRASGSTNDVAPRFNTEWIVQHRDVIWGLDFLPDGKWIFTERGGRVVLYDPGTKSEVLLQGVPQVWAKVQGGLLDVRVHPRFEKNHWIYFTYSKPMNEGRAATALARAKLISNALTEFRDLFVSNAVSSEGVHFGSRIEFDAQEHVFVSLGERNAREHAQDLTKLHGKIIRLNDDGSIPTDNPYRGRANARPEIWSLGHRNPQGLAFRPGTDELWSCEMGPKGGDELNLIRARSNYGWPKYTYGREYSGKKISDKGTGPGFVGPIVYWVPSISPSGMTFYQGDAFPHWRGDAFLAALSGTHLRRVKLNKNGEVLEQEALLAGHGIRFRSVRTGRDGNLYFTTDDGRIGRLVPRK